MSSLLGIDGLPVAVAQILQGRIYALTLKEDRFAPPLICATLLAALAANRPAWLVTETPPQQLFSLAGLLIGNAREAVAAGLIRAFHGQQTNPQVVIKDAAGRMMEELDYFAIPGGTLLAIDGGDRFLDTANNAVARIGSKLSAVERWRVWAMEREISVLFLCHRRDDNHNPAASLQGEADCFSGFARLRRSGGAIDWEVFHWFGPEGFNVGKRYSLVQSDDGRLAASDDSVPPLSLAPAVDESSVLVLRAAFPEHQALPSGWLAVDDWADLTAKSSNAIAATVILVFDRHTALDKLIHFVFALRQQRGNRLKIVVREFNVRLRYSQEILLTQLGCNLVVPAEVSHSRFLSLVSMVQGQIFPRVLPASYEDAVAAAMPVEQGYLPPSSFIEAVAAAVDSSRSVGVENALIRLPLVSGLRPIDALRYCLVKRPGDLCTSDGSNIYVFLLACREHDIALALSRLFQLPVSELFNGEHRYLSHTSISAAIEAFASWDGCDDLSHELRTLLADRVPIQEESSGHTAATEGSRMPRPTPAPALARPLPLRHLAAVSRFS